MVRESDLYPNTTVTTGLGPLGDKAMTRFLFLKADRIGHKNGSHRDISNGGIDVKLLSLLSARYV